ncbi:MAG: T9SS type A sorting domain-containing protein [Flavobacterium sp.]|nr:T9SS type A sorting domain-containing protein [Flavobacterium sp.]
MKKTVLLFLFISAISLAKPAEKPSANPAIGLIMTGEFFFDGQVQFQFHIKNYGEEALTNIYVTNTVPSSSIDIYSNLIPPTISIASLAPGEEDTLTFYGFKQAFCFDSSQAMVHATTASNTEITDLSDDDSYYENDYTTSVYFPVDYGFQEGIYQDLNGNNIVDVGDAVNYTYSIFSNQPDLYSINDDNAIIANPSGTGTFQTTGVHYLTNEDVTLGYVYNTSYFTNDTNFCNPGIQFPFFDSSNCNGCPNPSNANIVTKLTSLLPNAISGNVKFNANNDNCVTGVNYSGRRITTTSGSYSYTSYTNSSGNYSILIPNTGTYSTSANENLNANLTSNPSSVSVVSSGENIDYNNTNFCLSATTNYTDLSVTLIPVGQARPGFATSYIIRLSNYGTTSLNGTVVLTYENGKMTFNSASPTINTSTANTLTWNYSNLLPYQHQSINLTFTVAAPPTVNTGDTLAFTLVGNPIAGDNVPANNTFTLSQPVFSSYDPNDKTVLEGSSITLPQASRYLHYLTRFQNTGTANATTVVLKETLDAKLDWTTFEPMSSSHSYNVQIRNGNELTVTYSNIDLAFSSANEPASHGYFAYRIKPKNTVVVGDSFSSDAKIYFDYNPFIQTNTVTTTINALSTSDFEKNNFAVYPNPTSSFVTISSELSVDATFEISDINGKLLVNGKVENNSEIDISQLQSGFYLISINSDYQKQTFKIIKQ